MINDSMTHCRFCSVPIDPAVAALVAERQEKTNQACNDASYLKVAAIGTFVFLGISFIPLVPLAYWGFLVTFVVVLVLLIRWQVKFGNFITSDPDYGQAKRARNISLILLIVAVPLGLIIRPFLNVIISQFFAT